MKTTLFFFSFLLLAFSTTSLLVAAADPVLDVDGNEVQVGERYYALPLIWARGGGLTLSRYNVNGTLCPLNVVQAPSEVENGRPLVFTPILDEDDAILESTPVEIKFVPTPNICRQSTIWTADGAFITIGGDSRSPFSNFRIQKSHGLSFGFKTYKFVYCLGRRACQDVGRSNVNGITPLTLDREPWEVVFVKVAVEGSKIRKVTAGY